MQHKLLLGSTALVSAGLFMSAVPSPATRVGGIEVVLGGYTEFLVQAGTGTRSRTVASIRERSEVTAGTCSAWTRVHFEANGSTDRGVLYGSKVWFDFGSGGINGGAFDTSTDEAALFFSGNFGRWELGLEDGAEDVMFVGGPEAQAGTGGLDGGAPNLGLIEMSDTDDAAKITYFTPRVAGFQLGASFAGLRGARPAEDRFQGSRNEGENGVSGGANWVGAMGPMDLTVSGVVLWADCRSTAPTIRPALGPASATTAQLWWRPARLRRLLARRRLPAQRCLFRPSQVDIANVGLKYGFGAAHVSVGYNYKADDNDIDDAHIFVVSGDVGILPGVVLKGDVAYNTDDIGACEGGATVSGTTTQMLATTRTIRSAGSSAFSSTTEPARDALSRWCVGCRAAGSRRPHPLSGS